MQSRKLTVHARRGYPWSWKLQLKKFSSKRTVLIFCITHCCGYFWNETKSHYAAAAPIDVLQSGITSSCCIIIFFKLNFFNNKKQYACRNSLVSVPCLLIFLFADSWRKFVLCHTTACTCVRVQWSRINKAKRMSHPAFFNQSQNFTDKKAWQMSLETADKLINSHGMHFVTFIHAIRYVTYRW